MLALVIKGIAIGAAGLAAIYGGVTRTKIGRRVARKFMLYMLNTMPPPFPRDAPFAARVKPHGPLTKLADALWVVEGTVPGMPLLRNMLIYQLPGTSDLLLFSVMCVDQQVLDDIDRLGTVAYIHIPCSWHTLDADAYHVRYPNAKLLAPRRSLGDMKSKVAAPVEAVEDHFPEVTFPNSSVGTKKTTENPIRWFAAKGASDAFDEVELLVNLPGPSGKRAILANDLLEAKDTDRPRLSFIGTVLMVDDRRTMRKWMLSLVDMVREQNVEVFTLSHARALQGNSKICSSLSNAAKDF
ncbi:hypothetical protein DFJ77DRAFT_442802 [Powellomyces hirtus]|nr:hypothetical protein DFJ77DRAFT_442802 [Powellomyces hirtus]